METFDSIAELRQALAPLRDGRRVGLVPTMGALHEGHAALFRAARAECVVVVASLFVNPSQFADRDDLSAYPRDLERDAGFAAEHGVDVLFAPAAAELYPPGFAPWVATICLKLFNVARPDVAYFGRKDAQQLAVIKQLVRDLDLELEIRAVETVRDTDGLALSSRNARLSAPERERALAIPRALATRDPDRAREILTTAGIEPDYVAVADLDGQTLAVAARIGATRLIDNVLLER